MNRWIIGARPRTLPAAIAPVLVGTALIRINSQPINWFNALLALLVSLLLQIAVNYANDYSDGVRGTDSARVGPTRLVAGVLATAQEVKKAAYLTFFFASVAGLTLALRTSLWLVVVGVLAIFAAWNYTGGKKPYGYLGFGEVSVFIFFGVVATVGSYFAQSQKLTWQAFLVSIPMGALSCSILALNNLRDLPQDKLVDKKTLAVRIGDQGARSVLVGFLALSQISALLLCSITPFALLTLISLPITMAIMRSVLSGALGRDLIPLLGRSGKLQMVMALLIVFALVLAGV